MRFTRRAHDVLWVIIVATGCADPADDPGSEGGQAGSPVIDMGGGGIEAAGGGGEASGGMAGLGGGGAAPGTGGAGGNGGTGGDGEGGAPPIATPVVLASPALKPEDLVADDDSLYYFERYTNTLRKLDKDGGPPVTLADQTTNHLVSALGALALDSSYVYFTSNYIYGPAQSGVGRYPKAGGELEVVATATPGGGPGGIDVASGTAFWGLQTITGQGSAGALKATPVGGGATTDIETGGTGGAVVRVDGPELFWAADPWFGGVSKMSLPSGSTIALATEVTYSLAVDETSVYMLTNTGIKRVPRGGGAVADFANVAAAGAIASSGDDLYVADRNQNRILQITKATGAITVLATDQLSPRSIAVDATRIYWANWGTMTDGQYNYDGSIISLEKP